MKPISKVQSLTSVTDKCQTIFSVKINRALKCGDTTPASSLNDNSVRPCSDDVNITSIKYDSATPINNSSLFKIRRSSGI